MLFILMAFFGYLVFECIRHSFYTAAIIFGVVIGFLFCSWLLAKQCAKESRLFLAWLTVTYPDVKEGKAEYNGKRITLDSQAVQYQMCISFLFSVKISSGTILRDTGLSKAAAAVFSLGSFMLGWWGLPSGPVWTIQTIVNNLSGASRKSMESLIYDIELENSKNELQA